MVIHALTFNLFLVLHCILNTTIHKYRIPQSTIVILKGFCVDVRLYYGQKRNPIILEGNKHRAIW